MNELWNESIEKIILNIGKQWRGNWYTFQYPIRYSLEKTKLNKSGVIPTVLLHLPSPCYIG